MHRAPRTAMKILQAGIQVLFQLTQECRLWNGDYSGLAGLEVLTAVLFWDKMPCSSPFENQPKFRRNKHCLPSAFTLVSCSAYSSTLKMDATCSFETSVDFQRTTWRYIPEYRTLYRRVVTLPILTADQKLSVDKNLFITFNFSASQRRTTWFLVSQKEHGDPNPPWLYAPGKRMLLHVTATATGNEDTGFDDRFREGNAT
jgi:hypothetical protein